MTPLGDHASPLFDTEDPASPLPFDLLPATPLNTEISFTFS